MNMDPLYVYFVCGKKEKKRFSFYLQQVELFSATKKGDFKKLWPPQNIKQL